MADHAHGASELATNERDPVELVLIDRQNESTQSIRESDKFRLIHYGLPHLRYVFPTKSKEFLSILSNSVRQSKLLMYKTQEQMRNSPHVCDSDDGFEFNLPIGENEINILIRGVGSSDEPFIHDDGALASARIADLSRFATLNGFRLEFATVQYIASQNVLSQTVLHDYFDSKNDDEKVEGLNNLLFLPCCDDVAKEILLYADECGLDLSTDERFIKNAKEFREMIANNKRQNDHALLIVRLLHYSLDRGAPIDLNIDSESLFSFSKGCWPDSNLEVLLKYALLKGIKLSDEQWNKLLERSFELTYKYAIKNKAKIPSPGDLIVKKLSYGDGGLTVKQVAGDCGIPVDLSSHLTAAINEDRGEYYLRKLLECVDESDLNKAILPRLDELTTESGNRAKWLEPVLRHCIDQKIKLQRNDWVINLLKSYIAIVSDLNKNSSGDSNEKREGVWGLRFSITIISRILIEYVSTFDDVDVDGLHKILLQELNEGR
jgi:hypothetical protein